MGLPIKRQQYEIQLHIKMTNKMLNELKKAAEEEELALSEYLRIKFQGLLNWREAIRAGKPHVEHWQEQRFEKLPPKKRASKKIGA